MKNLNKKVSQQKKFTLLFGWVGVTSVEDYTQPITSILRNKIILALCQEYHLIHNKDRNLLLKLFSQNYY